MVVVNSVGELTLENISPISNIDCVEEFEPSSLQECGRSVNSEVGPCSDEASNSALSKVCTVEVRKVSSFSKRLYWGEVGAVTVHVEVSKLSFSSGDPGDKVPSLSNSQR